MTVRDLIDLLNRTLPYKISLNEYNVYVSGCLSPLTPDILVRDTSITDLATLHLRRKLPGGSCKWKCNALHITGGIADVSLASHARRTTGAKDNQVCALFLLA